MVQACLPVDLINGTARRYLSGLFTYRFSIDGVFLSVLPQKVTVNNRDISQKAMEVILPLLQNVEPGPQILQDLTLNNLNVEAKDDKLVFTVKPNKGGLSQIEQTSQSLSR